MPNRAPSALEQAFAVQRRASRKGFDWDDPADALAKVREETDEAARVLRDRGRDAGAADMDRDGARPEEGSDLDRLAEELGDLLFAVVNVARIAGVDPSAALEGAIAKFERRFAQVERLAHRRGLPMPGTPLPQLDQLWDSVKARSKT